MEQLLSVSARVVTTARARLSFLHVNELCCLHHWLIDEGMVTKEEAQKATEKRTKAFEKFAFLNLRREVEEEPQNDDSDDDSDDEQ